MHEIDIRGKVEDGRRWRYTDFGLGFAIYTDVSADAAAVYDKVIESACGPK